MPLFKIDEGKFIAESIYDSSLFDLNDKYLREYWLKYSKDKVSSVEFNQILLESYYYIKYLLDKSFLESYPNEKLQRELFNFTLERYLGSRIMSGWDFITNTTPEEILSNFSKKKAFYANEEKAKGGAINAYRNLICDLFKNGSILYLKIPYDMGILYINFIKPHFIKKVK